MTGQMQNLEMAIADIDDIAFIDDHGCPRGPAFVVGDLVILVGQGRDQLCRHLIADLAQAGDILGVPFGCTQAIVGGRRAKIIGLQAMDQAIVELVMSAHMVEMGVGGDRQHCLFQ